MAYENAQSTQAESTGLLELSRSQFINIDPSTLAVAKLALKWLPPFLTGAKGSMAAWGLRILEEGTPTS